ncbi:MAG: cytochrome b561 domain-containing protein [Geminicoccaceae bacterium]
MIEWLLTPLSGSASHFISPPVFWHARGMVLAWGILLPLGVLIARYMKITPGQGWPRVLDNPFWWNWHRGLQYTGIGIALAALALILMRGGHRPWIPMHGLIGWAAIVLGVAQVVSAWLRGSKGGPTGEGCLTGDLRGDHYDMTRRRLIFEYFHKLGGLVAVLLSVVAIVTGLVLADAPRWMLLAMLCWWGLLVVVALLLQRQGRCIDTYQAIWGPDATLPGNRRRPVGFGIRQLSPGSGQPFERP